MPKSLPPPLTLDHLVVAAHSLEAGVAHVRDALNIDMPMGGQHPRMGTHNALMSLGPDLFLEVIAIDPNAKPSQRPRWFDLDRFTGEPRLYTWVVGTPDIHASLTACGHPDSGQAIEMTRGDLAWLISVADNGALPLDGAFPIFIQWPTGPLPAASMTQRGCALVSVDITHPNSHEIVSRLDRSLNDARVRLHEGALGFEAVFDTPSGRRVLR